MDSSFYTFLDCSLPFSVGVRTSNENRGGSLNLPNIPPAKIFGQKWDQEVESVYARGVCLNYEQKPCDWSFSNGEKINIKWKRETLILIQNSYILGAPQHITCIGWSWVQILA